MPSSPSTPGSTTMATSPAYTCPSGVTTSTWSVRSSLTWRLSRVVAGEQLGLLGGLLDATDHEEGLLGKLVALALDEVLEAAHGVGERDVLARRAGERLGDIERLAEEALDLAGPMTDDFVLVRELVHGEDGDDVLQLLVALEDLLDAQGDFVVLVADRVAREDARVGVERVDGRVDALLRDRRATRGGGDALLQLAHLVGQRGLVAHGARHAAEERRDFGPRLD